MRIEDIRGRWDIVSWNQVYDDGRIMYPMGEDLTGFIEYASQSMFCVIARGARAPFASGAQWAASDAEKAAAYASYFSYAGDYRLDGDVVVHRVTHSLFPNWVGGEQRRQASLTGNTLHLTARLEAGSAQARTARLIWQRCPER